MEYAVFRYVCNLITSVDQNFMLSGAWLDYRANCVTQYGYVGNLLTGLANAFYNPNLWKAALK